MKISTFAVKIWRWASIIFVLVALFWSYSMLPDLTAISFSDAGQATMNQPKSTVFYIVMALFLLNNALIHSVNRYISRIPIEIMPIPNRQAWRQNRPELDEFLDNWLGAIVAAINTILGFGMLALATVNNAQFRFNVFDLSWLSYLSVALMLIVMLIIPFRLLWPPEPEISDIS